MQRSVDPRPRRARGSISIANRFRFFVVSHLVRATYLRYVTRRLEGESSRATVPRNGFNLRRGRDPRAGSHGEIHKLVLFHRDRYGRWMINIGAAAFYWIPRLFFPLYLYNFQQTFRSRAGKILIIFFSLSFKFRNDGLLIIEFDDTSY